MKTALIVRPTIDSPENNGNHGPTAYVQWWLYWTLWPLTTRDIPKEDLRGDQAIRGTFEKAVAEADPRLVIAGGHGLSSIFVGQFTGLGYSLLLAKPGSPEERPELKIELDNAELMKNRVVYLLSCLTARALGPYIIEKGGKAYAGYSEEFVWTVENPRVPAMDGLARPFGRVATRFPKSLVTGKTVGEAEEETRKQFDEEIERWERSDHPYAREVVKWLIWDRDAFTVLGDADARPVEPRPCSFLVRAGIVAAGFAGLMLRGA